MLNIDIHYFLHGLVVLLVSLLGGFAFTKAIKEQNGREVAWRVVHSGGSVAGVMLIALGLVVVRVNIPSFFNRLLLAGMLISTYVRVGGMVIAAITGARGIGEAKAKVRTWKLVNYLYGIGALLSLISICALLFFVVRMVVV